MKNKKVKSGYELSLRFIVDQKDENEILLTIGEKLGRKSKKVTPRKDVEGMSRLVLKSKFEKVIEYLNKFPLQTKKRKSLILWVELIKYTKQEELRKILENEEKLENIRKHIKSINPKDPKENKEKNKASKENKEKK